LRLHNAEYEYYNQLCNSEKSFFKKIYYWHESKMLKKYEKSICNKTQILAMAQQDVSKYKEEFLAVNISYLPVFLPFQNVISKEGNGCFCLYHGNLSVAENEAAAIWLLENVFNDLNVPFVIAGKNPSALLQRIAHQHRQTCLVSNPSEQEMQDMITKAQINILPSFNNTGIKLKLLNALFNGRHCIVNEQTIKSTGLESLCHVASGEKGCKNMINELYARPFHNDEIMYREKILSDSFNNEKNGKQLIEWIW
jgi:Glycosyl transferases group 1